MTVDPTDTENFNDRFREILDAEAPEADAAEQAAELDPSDDVDPKPVGDPLNANEADLAEQARVVQLNEDEYR
ncbi:MULTISPECIES: hypothetical protein [Streptomyces]|uniref:Uncharacterized protein n=1 Tax=Streptomyces dengpaensis TaxID=2049881 RepID=A0ABN5I1M7_9ACTN|nr:MULTISPECIES: hypothetical protein [Streptomyces]AVH56660.1 hypothetical protein C4B68_13735 [Streptomyces dengpaensis]PIB10315.1 hypothetical protein B1C81_07400 [Streptomyces sp. HG99]